MIIDYAMPGLSGAELATEALRRYPGQPIVLATGHADTTALRGELGKLPVLRKPFRIGELATVVSRTLVSVSANDVLAPRRQKSGSAGLA
jgi:FixJ family two-component response regulator